VPIFKPFFISSRFPRAVSKPISPDAGQPPYALLLGRNFMEETIQSPVAVFALISTLPYLNANELNVLIRALLIGFKMLS